MEKRFVICSAMAIFASVAIASGVLRTNTSTPAEIGVPEAAFAVGDEFAVTPFSDVSFALKIVSAPPAGIAGQSFIARDVNGSASAVVKATKTGWRITIDDFENRRQYSLRCKDGVVTVTETDTTPDGPDECGTCGGQIDTPAVEAVSATKLKATTPKLLSTTTDENAFEIAEHKSVVDILVAFDKGAKVWAENGSNWGNGGDSIEEFADYAVNKMNMVLVNSQLSDQFCYRLVGVVEIDGSWTAINNALLLSMRAREGEFANLEQLRDKYGADTITLLINRTSGNTSGIGFEYSGNAGKTLQYFEHMRYACNVCDINTVYSRYTMSHETGHNMGCGHSNLQGDNSGPGRYKYSCGYHFTDVNNVRRNTIMAYESDQYDNSYTSIPYFSTPDISPAEYGCALGIAGINDNRQTLLNTYTEIASLREHVKPYEWDVHFLDPSGNEILDGARFVDSCTVTFAHSNPDAEIYYTFNGTIPNQNSSHCTPGYSRYMYLVTAGSQTITACAVVDGVAQSIRSITIYDGLDWSGDSNGNGIWTKSDYSQTPWNGYPFEDDYHVGFPNLADVANAAVTVQGTVAPKSAEFSAYETTYTFSGDDDSLIVLKNAAFAPSGNLTFNVPVSLEAASFTLTPNHTLTFNAPFGTNVTASTSYGHCTNAIAFTVCGTTELGCNLTIAPGKDKTQVFNNFDNSVDNKDSTVRIGEGTTIFNGPNQSGYGVLCNAKVVVENEANLVFNANDATGYDMTSSFTINKGGTVTFNSYDTLHRPLILNGGTLRMNSANRLDWFNGNTITVTDDSLIEGVDGSYVHVRKNSSADKQTTVNVSSGKTLTVDIEIGNNPKMTNADRLVKDGYGEMLVKKTITEGTAIVISNGTFTVDYSCPTAYGTEWRTESGAKLKIGKDRSLTVPSLAVASGSTLSLPIFSSTALTVNGALDLDGVKLELTNGGNYSGGDRFIVLTAMEGLANFSESNIVSTPALGDNLEWMFEVTDNSLVAWIKDYGPLKQELTLVSNDYSLNITFPKDAEIGPNGGIAIDENPLVVDNLVLPKAVAITLDVEIPEGALAEEATICSWNVNDGYARCVRRTDNKLDCFHGTEHGHVDSTVSEMEITPGRHTITIAYYSSTDDDHGGTFVYLDNKLAYRAAGLRWAKKYDTVNCVTVGGTAYEPSTRIYNGLIVHGLAVIDALSDDPIPNVTDSTGNVKYEYMAQGHPCVFPLPPAGGFMLDGSILRATFASDRYDTATVSLVSSFPSTSTGTIVSLMVSDYDPITFQAEYAGDGKFMLRSSDSNYTTYPETCDIDVSKPHLYTIAYDGSMVTFHVDGNLLIESDMYWGEVVNEIDFGCGYWNDWIGNGTDNPNPLAGLKVYASDIELGTDDTAVSEGAIMASLNFDSKFYAGMTVKEKLAYLAEQQTANGVVSPFDERLPVVDILVAFDNGGVSYVNKTGKSLEEFAEEQIWKMNTILAVNKLDANYSYRLAGVCTVNDTYTDINATVSLIQEGAGPCTTLRAAREMYGADTVTLLVDTSGAVLGHSSQPDYQGDMAAAHDECFSVCSIAAVATGDQHTMIHENAHTLGCGHAREQYTAQDIAEHPGRYSYGYYFTVGNVDRHTIMAYSTANNKYYQPSPYFSTSSDEFGLTLGDAENDNARVIRATCGYVADWRESVKPFDGDVVISDEHGNELLSGNVFAANLTVNLSSPDGLPIYYTLDGTKPTRDSSLYSNPIELTADTTLIVSTLNGKTLNPPRTVKLFRIDALGPSMAAGIAWRTSVKYPWTDSGDGVIRSHNHTDYSYYCTTPLVATITGPKRLNFQERSYFRGTTPAQGSKYSHYEVLVDDIAKVTEEDCETSWQAKYVDILEGEHEVAFVYSQRSAMNNSLDNKDETPAEDDAVWLTGFALEDVECPHSSSRDDVTWAFPTDARLTDDHAHGVLINEKSIVNNFTFTTKGICASAIATLPENKTGAIAGCKVYRQSSGATFHAFAYSNGDGTFSLCYDNHQVAATSKNIDNWTAPHVWTFAFGAQAGAMLYCDGVEIASTTSIQWNNTDIVSPITFGNDPSGDYPLNGMKTYAVHTSFGTNNNILDEETASASVKAIFESLPFMDWLIEDSIEGMLHTFTSYRDTGTATPILATTAVLRISEIMPKPTDDRNPGQREGMDVNGLESGWVEVENTSDKWADLNDYRFIRVNRGKKTDPAGVGNFPSRLVPPRGRAIFYTSERYSNSKDKAVSAFAEGTFDGKPMIFEDYGNILVWGDKVNPKKSPYVRLYYAPGGDSDNGTVVDTVVVPSDLPEGWSIIVGNAEEGEGTRRWMCPTPTRGTANTKTDGLTRIGPNVGPLYEKKGQKKTDHANEFAVPVPPAVPGTDYTVTLPINAVMNPDGTFTPRAADQIQSLKFVYRKDLDDTTLVTNVVEMATKNTVENWGDQYTATIPSDYFPDAGHLMQWKVLITDGEGVEWTSPSFNNKDDGYEWYGTIVEPGELDSATLPTWHMFASGSHLTQMDYDKDDSRYTLENGARIAIYDSSTSNYYDYVRIDLRGNTSAGFTKKGHGLRFAKAHPLTMRDIVSGEDIKEIRKTSLISEFADPSYMRQMIAFWLWRKMGNLVPFDFPVRCNLNGEFYQLAFNSERFTDELIEDVYGLDKFGYSYKNVGTLKSGSGTTAGDIEKKTPDDEDESNITVLQSELRSKITAAQNVSGTSEDAKSSTTTDATGLDNAALTKFVVQKFDLPAWLNYLASAKITQEMDDVWANICAYYDNPAMLEGARGTGTWMPLGYDFNISFGQYYQGDIGSKIGLMSNLDWFKSHPFYGGNRVRCWKQSGMTGTCNNGNDGFEAVWQSAKFRRLYLRRLRTLMDQELKEPGTPESEVPFMVKMREMANLMRADSALDLVRWPDDTTDNAIDVWPSEKRPEDMDAGIDEIWNDYVVPRQQHLFVTHSVTNTAKAIGYGSNLNAGIPEAQSPIATLAPNIYVSNLTALDAEQAEALGVTGQLYDTEVVVIRNDNAEAVDMSGWRLAFSVDFTFPAGTVCDANDSIYIVADRRAYIDAHEAELTDQVIVGNATFTGAGPIALYDADGTLVYSAIPQTDELKYLRLHSFYGNTLGGGDTGEWFTLTNISDSVTLDLADVTVCFLKQGDDHDTTDHCHVTLTNKKGKGDVNPLKSWTAQQADYSDKGWLKIQNNKQQITIYDKYGSVCQSLKVTQKTFPLACGNGGYLVCDSVAASVIKDSDWHEALYELANDGASSENFSAEDQAAANELVANAKPVLSDDDIVAGLDAQYLTIVAEPVEDEEGKYKAVVAVDPETVSAPVIAEPTTEVDPVEVEEVNDGETTVSVSISNAVKGLWYGYEVSDELGESAVFDNDVDSFKRATGSAHTITGSPRTEPSGFFRVKVLPAKPKP